MKTKKLIKIIIDSIMLVLLLLLMGYAVFGQEIHEWLGVSAICVFIAHNILNFSYYKTLFKGKYNAVRIIILILNTLLIADIICLAVSGIQMSGFVFSFLNLTGSMMTARQMHLCASYWGFIIMSAHLGLNWSAVFPISKIKNNALKWALRCVVIAISGFGIYSFIQQDLIEYLFLRTHFVFFDYEMNTVLFFAEYISMIVLFAAVFYYISKLLKRRRKNEIHETR